MTTDVFTFYDIDSADHTSWSPATLRTYYTLVHLSLPYVRRPVCMADVASVSASLGAPQRPEGARLRYTLPTLVLPKSGEVVNDSVDIAKRLQALGHGDDAFWDWKRHDDAFVPALSSLTFDDHYVNILPYVPELLDDRGRQYFYDTRNAWFPKTLQAYRDDQSANDPVADVVRVVEPFASLYDGSAPFLNGTSLSYTDICVAAFLGWVAFARGRQTMDAALKAAHGGSLEPLWKWVGDNLALPHAADK
ncbi:uncharacterized protein PFL1_01855 [Pseudozyma flocculosa PF-1]|uniref:Glutathione S-transferase UstS-like C-terminal domain-containing protein n=1 Tax=Pseudozyma flocculosa TaxID=84751 RepID=A0A5C3F1N8_9BASI|nr:uncharacterized protein PFL1_01855 [Pseudozyma flocculosa PF-1]EPQ30329.1 hypothetical protein PFL1_01855 [Pseudozyma flocculosa PF-1]SPO37399.1 uncharacterized protein PSFLO_02872 [Pseudozyma flocculosa]